MSLCDNYLSDVECALALTNEFNTKLIILLILFGLALYLWWNSKYVDKTKSYYNTLLFYSTKYFTLVLIMCSPFIALLLSSNISFEMFIYFVGVVYLIAVCIGIGLLFFFAKEKVISFISREEKLKREEYKKYGRYN